MGRCWSALPCALPSGKSTALWPLMRTGSKSTWKSSGIASPAEPTPEEAEALKTAAWAVLPERVAYWSTVMGVRPAGIKITTAKKRYGSCSSKHSLCFSCYLMRSPMEAVDLVVVHELCHIQEMNHGPRFYALLERYLPDWRERKGCWYKKAQRSLTSALSY